MKALATGCLAEALQANVCKTLLHLPGGVDHLRELDIGRRVEIEDQPARHLGFIRRAVPGVQLEAADLRYCGEAFDAIDLQVRLAIAEDFYKLEQI